MLNPNNPDLLNAAYNSLRSNLNRLSYLRIVKESSSFAQNANGKLPKPLSTTDLQQVGVGSDLVVALEKFSQQIEDTYTVEIRRENLGNSTFREVDFYIGKRQIGVTIGWRLYNAKTGEVIDTWEEQNNYFYEAESRTRLRTTQLLNTNYRSEMMGLGSMFGSRYAARISPMEFRQTELLYSDGNEALRKGIIQVRIQNWSQAATIWEQGLRRERKRKKQAMLLHNLAINEQRKGNTSAAREWAAKAANKHPIGVKTQSRVGFSSTAF